MGDGRAFVSSLAALCRPCEGEPVTDRSLKPDAYARAGVDIGAGNEAVARYKALLGQWRHPDQLDAIGGFGGIWRSRVQVQEHQPAEELSARLLGVGVCLQLRYYHSHERPAHLGSDDFQYPFQVLFLSHDTDRVFIGKMRLTAYKVRTVSIESGSTRIRLDGIP